MSNCHLCGGIIAEPNKIYAEAQNMCRCSQVLVKESTDGQKKLAWLNEMEDRKVFEYKESIKRILEVSSNLSLEQLRAVIDLLKQLHDCQSLSANPGQFKKREF